jgi:hypothetical protein
MTWPGLDPLAREAAQRRLEFCRKADALKLTEPGGYFELKKPPTYSCKLADLFASAEELAKACARYRAGDIVAAEFVVTVRKKQAVASDSSFLVYLQKDDLLTKSDETFIRDGLTIIGEKCIREAGVRALVLAEDPVLTEFLGDAENPAHTRWLSTTKHFRGKYTHGAALLDYVRNSAFKLANLLGKVENEMLENLLDEVFGIPTEEESKSLQKQPTKQRGGKKPGPGGFVSKRYLVTKRLVSETGFKVSLAQDATARPDKVVIRVAHQPETGDPFRQFHPADFDFTDAGGAVRVELRDCTLISSRPNRLEIEPLTNDFEVKVTGFDRNRDLSIDAKPQFEADAAKDEQ